MFFVCEGQQDFQPECWRRAQLWWLAVTGQGWGQHWPGLIGGWICWENFRVNWQKLLGHCKVFLIFSDFQSLTRDFQPLVGELSIDESEPGLNATERSSNLTAPDTPLVTISQLSRLVCGRNISGNPFSSGGQANRSRDSFMVKRMFF